VADGGVATESGSASPNDIVREAVEREEARVERLMTKDDGIQHSVVRDEIQETMTEHVNVFREEEGLEQALADIRQAREDYQHVQVSDPSRTFNTDLIHTIETRNIIDLAEAITLGALARDEFRGAHWRAEHRERDDENWLKHTLLSWNEGDPELWYRPVVLEGQDKKYEPKIRSY
ncbi:MAG: succinate dehydrogenase, partial [Halobaculum sp.]